MCFMIVCLFNLLFVWLVCGTCVCWRFDFVVLLVG